MRRFLPLCFFASLVALSGCTLHYSSRTESAAGPVQVNASSGSPLGNAIIVGVMAADAMHYYRFGPDGKTAVKPPLPDPTRKIDIQECTRPVDTSAGNLLCR